MRLWRQGYAVANLRLGHASCSVVLRPLTVSLLPLCEQLLLYIFVLGLYFFYNHVAHDIERVAVGLVLKDVGRVGDAPGAQKALVAQPFDHRSDTAKAVQRDMLATGWSAKRGEKDEVRRESLICRP